MEPKISFSHQHFADYEIVKNIYLFFSAFYLTIIDFLREFYKCMLNTCI